MTVRSRGIRNWAYALIVPFFVQGLLVVGIRTVEASVRGFGDVTFAAPLLSSAVGFSFIRRDLTREQMILIGFFYFVAMYPFLLYFSLLFVGNLYGDWL